MSKKLNKQAVEKRIKEIESFDDAFAKGQVSMLQELMTNDKICFSNNIVNFATIDTINNEIPKAVRFQDPDAAAGARIVLSSLVNTEEFTTNNYKSETINQAKLYEQDLRLNLTQRMLNSEQMPATQKNHVAYAFVKGQTDALSLIQRDTNNIIKDNVINRPMLDARIDTVKKQVALLKYGDIPTQYSIIDEAYAQGELKMYEDIQNDMYSNVNINPYYIHPVQSSLYAGVVTGLKTYEISQYIPQLNNDFEHLTYDENHFGYVTKDIAFDITNGTAGIRSYFIAETDNKTGQITVDALGEPVGFVYHDYDDSLTSNIGKYKPDTDKFILFSLKGPEAGTFVQPDYLPKESQSNQLGNAVMLTHGRCAVLGINPNSDEYLRLPISSDFHNEAQYYILNDSPTIKNSTKQDGQTMSERIDDPSINYAVILTPQGFLTDTDKTFNMTEATIFEVEDSFDIADTTMVIPITDEQKELLDKLAPLPELGDALDALSTKEQENSL